MTEDLTDDERFLLDQWGKTWRYPGRRVGVIYERTGWSSTKQASILNRLLDTEAALAYAPLTVKRLQRLRAARQRSRSSRASG